MTAPEIPGQVPGGGGPAADPWRPATYDRFADERSQPFFDLLGLCREVPGGRVADLGCGTGRLTAELHARSRASGTVGVDLSATMLAEAASLEVPGLTFRYGDIAAFGAGDTGIFGPSEEGAGFDLVFSNAALQWVPEDHRDVLARWTRALRSGGQMAVQVPANVDHASHLTAAEVAAEEPFFSAMAGSPPPDPVRGVLRPEAYAEALHRLGFVEQHVRLQVYGHVLATTEAVVDWVSGTSLNRFRTRLDPELFGRFVDRYRERLLSVLGRQSPYFYTFKRILLWGRLG